MFPNDNINDQSVITSYTWKQHKVESVFIPYRKIYKEFVRKLTLKLGESTANDEVRHLC